MSEYLPPSPVVYQCLRDSLPRCPGGHCLLTQSTHPQWGTQGSLPPCGPFVILESMAGRAPWGQLHSLQPTRHASGHLATPDTDPRAYSDQEEGHYSNTYHGIGPRATWPCLRWTVQGAWGSRLHGRQTSWGHQPLPPTCNPLGWPPQSALLFLEEDISTQSVHTIVSQQCTCPGPQRPRQGAKQTAEAGLPRRSTLYPGSNWRTGIARRASGLALRRSG